MKRTHRGFFMEVDGHTAHVLGDPNMDQRTKDALATVIRAAYKRYATAPSRPVTVPDVRKVSERTARIRRNQRGSE